MLGGTFGGKRKRTPPGCAEAAVADADGNGDSAMRAAATAPPFRLSYPAYTAAGPVRSAAPRKFPSSAVEKLSHGLARRVGAGQVHEVACDLDELENFNKKNANKCV